MSGTTSSWPGYAVYFAAHAFGNATLDDLLSALTDASGRDMKAWSAAWLETTGLNTLSADFELDEAGRFTSFAVLQSGAAPGAGELRPHRLAVGVYDTVGSQASLGDDRDGALVRTHRVELDVAGERTEVPELIGLPRGALILVNDDDLTYCKLLLDAESLDTAVHRIGDIAESLPRTLVWSAVWEMTRDAKMRARDFVSLALNGLPGEDEIGVVQRVLSQIGLALGSYAEPGWAAETGWPSFADTVIALARSAEPGSDVQLAAVGALAQARLTEAQVDVLAGWRDGSAALPGLTVDTDLSWSLLCALVAHGRAGTAEIGEAAAADATASGERRAAAAMALRPTAEDKRAIWDRLIGDDGMANALQDAAISGFAHPAQGALLAAFTDGYFAEVAGVWSRRSVEVATKVAVGLYPRWAIAQSTVDQARAWDASEEHPPALRRLVSEGRAGTERALSAREADAG